MAEKKIHPSFPPKGKEQKAHLGSQSKFPMKEGSMAEEAAESPAFEAKEKAKGID